MGRLKSTNKKHINSYCIFCGRDYMKNRICTAETRIDYVPIQPLGKELFAVCIKCRDTTLKDAKIKYPDLFK